MTNKHAIHRTGRDRVVNELLAVREQVGSLNRAMFEHAARDCGYSVRQLQRQIAAHDVANASDADDAGNGNNAPDKFVVDEDVAEMVMRTCGNISSAHDILQRRGHKVPSLSTFRRHVINAMGATMLGYAKNGSKQARASKPYLKRNQETRGYTYFLDHTELPILVIPDGYKTAVRPWMTAVMDAETRYVLSWHITFGTPSAEEVRAALIAAFTLRIAADGETIVGGAPARCLWDRGLDFLSDLVTESCLRLQVTPVALPAYSPHLKGRLERFWRYLKENALPPLPGYTDAGHDLRGNLLLAANALSESAFLLEIAAWMDRYNTQHVNRSLRSTALQAWQSDPAPLREIPYDQLWQDFLLSEAKHKVGNAGIRVKSIDYVALKSELEQVYGRTVEVRYLPHDRSFIEVFHAGKHIGTCYPVDQLRPDDEVAFLEARKKTDARARQAFSVSNRLRGKHEGAQRIEKHAKRGQATEYRVKDPHEIDLFTGADEALKKYAELADDPQGRLL